MKIAFFVDFDGTITKRDTCLAMSETFAVGDWESIEEEWAQGLITTAQSARRIFDLFDADRKRLLEMLKEIEIDDFFIPFLEMCRQRGYQVYILSDGYDINIETILEKYGISDVPYYANELLICGGDFDIQSPHGSETCDECGTCKTELFNKLKPADALTVYIGDGLSDTCASKEADVVFAKHKLLAYRKKHQLPVIPFEDFNDILEWEKSLSHS